jgi:hypothetical protein
MDMNAAVIVLLLVAGPSDDTIPPQQPAIEFRAAPATDRRNRLV